MVDVGVFAAILDEWGQLLLCRRRDIDLWEMPGGGVDPCESPWDAVKRDVSEETNLQIEVSRLVGLYWRPARALLVLQFECRGEGLPAPSSEAREVQYFSMDALPEPINPAVVERISDVRDSEPTVQMRVQHAPSGREWVAAWEQAQGI